MKQGLYLIIGFVFLSSSSIALGDDNRRGNNGLNQQARQELSDSGLDQYLGKFSPAGSSTVGDGWTKHTYAPDFIEGPMCIAGTPYSVFTKEKNPKNLLIFMQGGGACWQDFYFCNILSEDQEPPPPPIGIWGDAFPPGSSDGLPNPLADYSIVYLPYCDGSVFTGDKDVLDSSFPFSPVRFHRGLQNASAGIDLARNMFPDARRILVAGSSAGGVGASAFSPFLIRMAFGNQRQLSVFNDAGPVAVNLNDVIGIPRRAADWDFGRFYPASCTDCNELGQQTDLIKWRLDNDSTIRESFYSTDGDGTNRFFLGVPTQVEYRNLIVTEHGKLNAAHPSRYKRFIRSGDDSHTALQDLFLFYLGTANGVPLFEWVEDFLNPGARAYREIGDATLGPTSSSWVDIVEDFEPLPVP